MMIVLEDSLDSDFQCQGSETACSWGRKQGGGSIWRGVKLMDPFVGRELNIRGHSREKITILASPHISHI